jgi:hypothetical protein
MKDLIGKELRDKLGSLLNRFANAAMDGSLTGNKCVLYVAATNLFSHIRYLHFINLFLLK